MRTNSKHYIYKNKEPIEIMLKNQIILSKESTQFQGIILDSRLNWEEHINKLRAKAKRVVNTIKVVAEKKRGGDQETLKNCTVQYVVQKQTMAIKYTIQYTNWTAYTEKV